MTFVIFEKLIPVITLVNLKYLSFEVVRHGVVVIGFVLVCNDVGILVKDKLFFFDFSFLTVDFLQPYDGKNVCGRFAYFLHFGFEFFVSLSFHDGREDDGRAGAYSFDDLAAHGYDVWLVAGVDKLVFVVHFEVYFFSFEHVFVDVNREVLG